MKIGTLTFHRACNNGALLQAYALITYLNKIDGVEAEIINYKCDMIDYAYKPTFCFYNCNKIKGIIKFLIRYCSIKKRNMKFNEFRNKKLKISSFEYNKNNINKANDEYDLFISGSDQIWNYNLTDNDETYLLSFVNDKSKKYTYAASFGISNIEDKYKNRYSKLLNDFTKLSVREENASQIINELINKKSFIHIDPVFLLDKSEWEKLCVPIKEDKYILVYMVGMGKTVNEMIKFSKELSKKTGYKLLFMNTENIAYLYYELKHINNNTPDYFLSYIKNAEYVVTNSFHVSCFSIIFNKKFYTEVEGKTVGGKKSSRIINLLNKCELSSHIMKNGEVETTIFNDDWNNVNKIIEGERKKAYEYLNNIIKRDL